MGRARMGLRRGGAVHASKPKIGSDVNAASLMLQSAQSTATDPCRTHAVSFRSSAQLGTFGAPCPSPRGH